ncbi:hypothetical protein H1Y64_001046 [Salmonella enterica]|uniref:Uncharacterized protein n=1 Tax=Salmonella enterica TaxID=28901 RepID=A0A7D8EU41_SALER|nr:hypothetical protein [Salmonella enterica]ECT8868118.1 hypothetical protein [Salmonella enterica subsp. enterica serovar Pensacola]EDR2901316.1 hypothetical protein [Salmonella enterica subsp. enterica serovar Amherstiana]EDU6096814.1 hypothetical protein [Salmonella enterica subsp. enterica serovar Hvittingfoss]EDX2836357.1 hypothetical protein [Salmonella enterica subsp. enterica serovar Berta]EGQ2009737.1 hypothetical protein [Salmonella enterica subsp. enterica serovar Infantis]
MKMRKLRIIVKETGGYLAISRHENPQKSWENTTITVPPITEATYTEINGVILRRFSSAINRQLFFAAPKKRPHCCRRSGVHEVFTQTGMITRYVNDGTVPAPHGLILSI